VIYQGTPLTDGEVALSSVDPELIVAAPKSPDYAVEIERWCQLATTRDDIVYFAVLFRGELVGHILLHDWDRERRTSLVGYHLFEVRVRGQGIGTKALRLLQDYAVHHTDLRQLIAITSDDNFASRSIGRMNGFRESGPSREDALHGVVMVWDIFRPTDGPRGSSP
jgi:RimJ/RimL family protein N-acetyltransferase